MAKKTRRLRITLDILVDFEGDLETLPMGGSEDHDALLDAMVPVILAQPGVEKVRPAMSSEFRLDYRKPKEGA